ncbi:GPI-GlcNAc transferase complex, PIG-H component-domain-containing protein [Sphaerosporella brunnea]|uniref:GPI-GlcNAc transferase complex, PIG-H component-domain-containing protein n=1 Tax=Sphaerosporella brunnea TaxID=1250544 RepID=A0A5J5F8X1_9PEZI|nr:GPI-GlcNAc transferase complex, PIG-H component-domain-containing protein [Sphaerosporella brunnea]
MVILRVIRFDTFLRLPLQATPDATFLVLRVPRDSAPLTNAMPPTLHIRSPSSTTTEFTVTTRPPPSLRRTVTSVITALLRLLAFLTVTVLLLSQHSLLPSRLQFLRLPPQDPRFLYPTSLATLWLIVQRGYTEEGLLVIRSLGVQTSTTAGTWLGMGKRTRFIPTEKVRDIIVNEGFVGMEVRFYVAVVVEGEGSLVVVFPTLLPNRRCCEVVWRGAKRCLYQPDATSTKPPAAADGDASSDGR